MSTTAVKPKGARRVWDFIQNYSILLVIGAVTALIWANTDAHGYHHFVEHPLWFNDFFGAHIDHWRELYGEGAEKLYSGEAHYVVTVHYLINDMLMALFFAIAGKEVWEAVILKDGALRGSKAVTPLIATAGGILGPVGVYLLGAFMVGKFGALANGWAIPTATDIAFSYLVGRIVFGARHPAVTFLLLLAIADDAVGLAILAVFYPQGELHLSWLLLSVGASLAAYLIFNLGPRLLDKGPGPNPRSVWVMEKLSFWPYLIAGAFSWYGFAKAGIHPALGLLPIIPAMPHADIAYGIFSADEADLEDVLNKFEHSLKTFVEFVLLMFGLANAGVEFSAIGAASWLVLAGLIIGKPLGVYAFGLLATRGLKFSLPEGVREVDLIVIGCVAAIGFTVSLFIAGVAFRPGAIQDAAKMGALFSFGAVFLSLIVGKLARIQKQH